MNDRQAIDASPGAVRPLRGIALHVFSTVPWPIWAGCRRSAGFVPCTSRSLAAASRHAPKPQLSDDFADRCRGCTDPRSQRPSVLGIRASARAPLDGRSAGTPNRGDAALGCRSCVPGRNTGVPSRAGHDGVEASCDRSRGAVIERAASSSGKSGVP